MEIKVLLIGDIVGKPGRSAVKELLGDYVASNGIEFVIANGENAAQGSGITENLFKEIVGAGVDVVTSGDMDEVQAVRKVHSELKELRDAVVAELQEGTNAAHAPSAHALSPGRREGAVVAQGLEQDRAGGRPGR